MPRTSQNEEDKGGIIEEEEDNGDNNGEEDNNGEKRDVNRGANKCSKGGDDNRDQEGDREGVDGVNKGEEEGDKEEGKSNEAGEKQGGKDICDVCKDHKLHLVKADESREMYRADVLKNTDSYPVFSMDMQKVLMLPHLPGMKTALFTQRIILINQSIVPVGKFSEIIDQDKKARGYIWHEAIQG